MAIEDDVSALQTQVATLQNTLSNLQSSINTITGNISNIQTAISSINTNMATKAPINNPNFTGTAKVNDNTISTTTYVDDKIQEISGNDIPLPPAVIQGGMYDSDGNYINYYSDGVVGTNIQYARSDHKHPGDITRAPLASPMFSGIARSDYTPEKGSDEYDGNCIANTRFVLKAIKDYTTTPPVSVTPPSGEGELPQAEIPGQPGGNSENTNIGGGAPGGSGGSGGKGASPYETGIGKNGGNGGDGGDGSYTIVGTEYEDNYNWNIATYVHT